MNFRKNFVFSALLFLLSCSKGTDKVKIKGEVIRQPNYCTSSTGFPFIIKYTTITNQVDSFITTTLPVSYKFIGKKIEFEMREFNSQDEKIACTNLFGIPKQAVIFNVSPN